MCQEQKAKKKEANRKQSTKRIYISNHFEMLFTIFDFIKLHLYISFLNAAKKTDRQTDVQTDGWKDGQNERQTNKKKLTHQILPNLQL